MMRRRKNPTLYRIPSLLDEGNKFAWFFLLGLEGNRIIRIKHAGVITFQLLSWFLGQGLMGEDIWRIESEDHVDFYIEYTIEKLVFSFE
jgi:hypothetical protein